MGWRQYGGAQLSLTMMMCVCVWGGGGGGGLEAIWRCTVVLDDVGVCVCVCGGGGGGWRQYGGAQLWLMMWGRAGRGAAHSQLLRLRDGLSPMANSTHVLLGFLERCPVPPSSTPVSPSHPSIDRQ